MDENQTRSGHKIGIKPDTDDEQNSLNDPTQHKNDQTQHKKSILQRLRERILTQQRDVFCNLLESKTEEIENLMRDLEEIGQDVNEAQILNQKMNYEVQPKNQESEIESTLQDESISETKLKEIHDVMNEIKNALKALKNGMHLLEKLRKNQGTNDLFLEKNICDEEHDKVVIKRIATLKNQIMCRDDSEKDELKDRMGLLHVENKELRQQLKDAEVFLSEYDKENIYASDRDKIKLVQHDLISKQADLSNVKYTVQDASRRLKDTKECLQNRQDLVRNYKLKCDHVQDLLKQQEESIPLMETQHNKIMRDLENEFVSLKSSLTQELQHLIPVIDKLKEAQKRLQDSETLMGIAKSKKKAMGLELCGLKSQIEKLYEDIHWAKKNEPSQEQNEQLGRQLRQWENDTEVQLNQRVQLKEKTQQLKWEIKKSDTKAQEKQKEMCQLKILETDLRETLLEQYKHRMEALGKCGAIYNDLGQCCQMASSEL